MFLRKRGSFVRQKCFDVFSARPLPQTELTGVKSESIYQTVKRMRLKKLSANYRSAILFTPLNWSLLETIGGKLDEFEILKIIIIRIPTFDLPLQWRHNGCDGVSNRQPQDCLLNRLFKRRLKMKTSKLRGTGLCDRWIRRTNGQ